MPFEIIRNDITNMRVDATVNTANPRPVIGSGVDAAIHAKAGPMLLSARKLIGIMNTGEARITPGFRLPCKHVIHTVGPVWEDGGHGEAWLLRQCYENSLRLALRHRCKSVAFPLISSGNYGFPKKVALDVAVEAIREFLKDHEMHVYLVVFSKESLELSGGLADQVRSFVDGVLFSKGRKKLYAYPAQKTDSEYQIPDMVEEICHDAFQDNKYLRRIYIPAATSEICGQNAFEGCENLCEICVGADSRERRTMTSRSFFLEAILQTTLL